MKSSTFAYYSLSLLAVLTAFPANSQPITPANDGTGTTVNQNGNQFNIEGGTQSGANLFHSFDQFNVNSGQIANFLTTPDTSNILGRVTGGNASYINGLIQVIGSNSNLFLMNPAGIIFGPNASLNIPASFSVTTATGIGFDNNNFWFKAMGTNDYSNLVGNPSGYRFNVSTPGAIVNEGNLQSGENLTLLGGTVINTGELSTAGGNITIAAVEGGSVLRISQPGHLLSLDIDSRIEDISNLDTLSLPQLLTGGSENNATSIIVNSNGELELTDNTIIADTPGNVFVSGKIDLSNQDLESNLIILANNDIKVDNLIEISGFVEFKAGKSINLNADIDTSVGNGNIDLFGNNDEMNVDHRYDGKASINQLDGTTLNAGSGTINIELGNLGEVGDINLANLTTTGEVLVNANGGNIVRVSENSLISAGSVLFQTNGNGGIGFIDSPLQLDVENLEAVSGSGGVFFDVGNINIGGVSEDVDGIVTAGGDIDIKSDGDVTLNEAISTIETVENNSEVEARGNTEIADTSGSINIEATGDIIATGSGIKGGGENVSLSATNIRINDEFDETSGDADVKLEATNDITVEDIEDDVLEFLPGSGEIEFRADVDGDGVGVVEMLDNEADVGSDPNTFENGADTIKTNGRNLTIAGAEIILGNIDTSSLPIYSGGELLAAIDVDEGGPIPPEVEDKSGFIPFDSVDFSDIEFDYESGNYIIDGKYYYIATIEGQDYFIPITQILNDTATFTFTVDNDLGNVENLDVRFSVEHTYNRNLKVTLESPQGQEVKLFADIGSYGQPNFQDTVLDDDASISINSGNAPFNSTYRPQGSLADFNGENSKGTWILKVRSLFVGGDSGTLYKAGDVTPWGTAIGTQLLLRNSLVQSGGGNGGAINIEATHGDISVGNIRSFSETADGGTVDLKANNNIITGLINSASRQGNGGTINLNAISGNILTYSLDASSIDKDGGNIQIKAAVDITTADIITESGEFFISDSRLREKTNGSTGNAGNISIESTTGSIDTTAGSVVSRSVSGDGGDISISAISGDITTNSLDSSSSSYQGSFLYGGNSGNGGAISLEAEGNITTEYLTSSSSSYGGTSGNARNGGNITISAISGDITTASVFSNSSSEGDKSGDGGDITISAISGDITTASVLSSSSRYLTFYSSNSYIGSHTGNSGDGGNITISTISGDITTQSLSSDSSAHLGKSGDGGDITISTISGDITTASVYSNSRSIVYSDFNLDGGNSGDGGNITISAISGDITTGSLHSNSHSTESNSGDGGDITISTISGDVTIESLYDSSGFRSYVYSDSASNGNSGDGGDITISAVDGDITINSLHSSSSTFYTGKSGDGGDITISAVDGDITINFLNSFSFSDRGNSGNGGAISVEAGGNITTESLNSSSSSDGDNSGDGGAISLNADTIKFNPPENGDTEQLAINTFSVGTNASGNGGEVNITTNNLSNAEILTLSSHGKSGEVTIESQQQGNLKLNDLSIITSKQLTIQFPNATEVTQIDVGDTQGQSGDVSIISNGHLNLKNVSIESDTKEEQPAGNVNIYSLGNISLDNTDILSITSADGNAGNITLETDQNIVLTNNSRLQASTEATGNAGSINIQANNLNLDQSTSLITETLNAGNPGSITIEANTVDIGQDAQISATVVIGSTSNGDGGNITINTNQLNITGKLGIFAETEATANAGILTLAPYKNNPDLDINFSNEGFISASTSSTGNGGNIFISAPENIDISGQGFIAVETSGTGNAGIIDIQTNNLTISDGVAISASTEDKGNAGQINIKTKNFTLETGTSLTTETTDAGKAGNIEINTRQLTIGEDAQISATARVGASNTEAGGNITINATDILISGRLGIFAETAGESPAGTLTLNPYRGAGEQGSRGVGEQLGEFEPNLNITFTENGFISARTTSTGDGGNINIFAPENIDISGEGKISVETTGSGNAGIINIQTENLTLKEGVAISAETNSPGTAGNILINSPTVTIGENAQISATAKQNATATEAGGNITINTNELNISGILGIFAETQGESPAGTLILNPYNRADGNPPLTPPRRGRRGEFDPDLNITFTDSGFISARTLSIGDGGNINIFAPKNINISGEGRITVETTGSGDAGIINIETENLTIAENTTISAATSDRGDGGTININPRQTFQLEGQILTETTGEGNGGTININTGEMTAPNSTISAKSTAAGNAGQINIQSENNITTGIITSEANNKTETANGGNITITSEQGEINATQPIQSFSEGANAGDVTLQAKTDITTNTISSHGQKQGGKITITSETGNIDTTNSQFLANYSGGGDAGNLTLAAPQGDITTNNIYSFADADGGQITLQAGGNINITEDSNIISASEPPEEERGSGGVGRGGDIILEAGNNINTKSARIYSGADIGDTGKIDIIAENTIETGQIDLASGFVRQERQVNNNFTLIPIPQGEATQGIARHITLRSNNSTINTTAGTINSRSPDGTGNITLNARENITTGKLEASALNQNQATRGGDVEIISQQGEINATQEIETFSQQGTAGNVNIRAESSVNIENILSQGTQRGGDITINSRSQNSINAQGTLNTFSEAGTAGDVTLTSPGNITINGIRSEGMQQGGTLRVESEIGEITSTGNIDSFSEQGIGGNVTLTAPESVNLANVSSFGATESGDLIIQSSTATVNTENVTTQADGPSGNIRINGTQITTGNLTSLGTTSAGILQLEATDGSITTLDLNSIASEGEAGGIDLDAPGDITTEDQTVISGDGDAQIDTNIGGNLNAETQTVEATNGDAEINNQVDGNIEIDSQTAIATNGDAEINNTGNIIDIDSQTAIATNGDAEINNTGNIIDIDSQTAIATNGDAIIENRGNIINIPEQRAIAPEGTEIITNSERNNTTTPIIPTQTNPLTTNNPNPILRVETNPSTTVGGSTNTSITTSINRTQANTNTNSNQLPTTPINNNIISTITPSNNNQTTNTATAKEKTESSINNTTDTQQILNIIDTVNTTPLTVATGSDQIVTMLEQNRIKEFSNYFGEDFNERLVNTKNVRDMLTNMANQTGKESAVVYINAYNDQIQIILFTKDGQPILKTIPTVNRQKLWKNAIMFTAGITDFRNRHTTNYLPLAQKFYQWLIEPIEAELEAANIDTILFSMDDGFRLLPLAALHDGEQFLIEKYSISLIPSVSLMDSRYNSLKNTNLLGMGASQFTDKPPLPAVPVELQTISEKLWRGNTFLNEEFTKNNLINELENRLYPIVHLATHAEFRAGDASDSYIQLWDDKLGLDEVRKLRWNSQKVELLVLSACRTAVGDYNAELGFAGLAIATGVKSAMGSFWLVNDEATLGLMTEFYAHLSNVKIKAEALREAQLGMLRGEVIIEDGKLRGSGSRGEVSLPPQLANIHSKNFAHPYYWAGFTMVGSPW